MGLLVERGFAAVTVESIASRARVGKATVYRRWPNKADLIVNAFFETVTPRVRFEGSTDLRENFRAQLRLVVREMTGPNGRALAALLGCMQMDRQLAESFRTRWLAVRRAEARLAIVNGIERGDLPAETDPDFVLDALYSPLHFRLLAAHQPLTNEFSDRLVDLVFDGLHVPRAGATPSNGANAKAERAKLDGKSAAVSVATKSAAAMPTATNVATTKPATAKDMTTEPTAARATTTKATTTNPAAASSAAAPSRSNTRKSSKPRTDTDEGERGVR